MLHLFCNTNKTTHEVSSLLKRNKRRTIWKIMHSWACWACLACSLYMYILTMKCCKKIVGCEVYVTEHLSMLHMFCNTNKSTNEVPIKEEQEEKEDNMEENIGEAPKPAEPVLSTYLQYMMKCCTKIVSCEVCVKAWFNNQDAYMYMYASLRITCMTLKPKLVFWGLL